MHQSELTSLITEHANKTLDGHYRHNGLGIRDAHHDGYQAGFKKALELVFNTVDLYNSDDAIDMLHIFRKLL